MPKAAQIEPFKSRNLAVAALVITSSLISAQAQNPVPKMRQYVDASHGFSFWYPAAWTVKRAARVTNPTNSGWYSGAKVVARLSIVDRHTPDSLGNYTDSVDIEVLFVPSGEFIEHGDNGVNPVGADEKFSFDPKVRNDGARYALDGHPISYGASRHAAGVIVPLNRTHFLSLSSSDPGGNMNHLYIAESVVAGGLDAAKRVNPRLQSDAIHLEALKLGIIGQPIGQHWHSDGVHVYNEDWKLLPGANPNTFVPLAENYPGDCFASDGLHVYHDNGQTIPNADPKTFEAIDCLSAKDAHNKYDWNGGTLKIDGVPVPK